MEFKFDFLNGWYLIVSDDVNKQERLTELLQVQKMLHSLLPARSKEIDGFILSCVNDLIMMS